jgi:hypothetical protein
MEYLFLLPKMPTMPICAIYNDFYFAFYFKKFKQIESPKKLMGGRTPTYPQDEDFSCRKQR